MHIFFVDVILLPHGEKQIFKQFNLKHILFYSFLPSEDFFRYFRPFFKVTLKMLFSRIFYTSRGPPGRVRILKIDVL